MPRIINVEKSQYLNDNIEIYTSNKVGQYSKFLDKNPLFVTYFHINEIQTRTDVGTGGVKSDLGPTSPIRFNQINGLPAYNIPDLKPDVEYGENGYDIEMELSDVVLLPNTIKPITGDYVLIVLPNTIEFLFRVNGFNYNTIQSNDYYTFSADLKHTGHNLISKLQNQVVDVYETIFENIGTDDKCFILQQDVKKIQNIGKMFLEMRDSYYNNFFDTQTGSFVCKNNDITPMNDAWYYDKYVEKFIMESGIYYTENDEHSIVLTCCDLETPDMNSLFMQTLHYAVLNHTIDYLSSHMYGYQVGIQKRLSPFIINHLNCKGINLVITKDELVPNHSDALDCGLLYEYFHHELIRAIKGEPEPIFPEEPEEEIPETPDEPSNEESKSGENEDSEEGSSVPEENIHDSPIENPDGSDDVNTPEDILTDIDEEILGQDGSSEDNQEITEADNTESNENLENDSNNESEDNSTETPNIEEPNLGDNSSDENDETTIETELPEGGEAVIPQEPINPDVDESDTPSDEPPDEYVTDFYLDKIIYQYLTNRMLDIDRKQLIPYMLKVDNYTYMMMPLVMYVIMKYYESYFEKTEL